MLRPGIQVYNIVPNRYFIYNKGAIKKWLCTDETWHSTKDLGGWDRARIRFFKTEEEAKTFLNEWIDTHPVEFAKYVAQRIGVHHETDSI